jgi:hypothetical protein
MAAMRPCCAGGRARSIGVPPLSGLDEIEGELPDGVEDDENYIAVPHKRELGLGKPRALDFAREFLLKDVDDVRYMFSKRGAYQKF